MDCYCDLEVDVNGEESFMVDKKTISSYSGRLSKLYSKSTGTTRNLKVIFNDFPGGAEGFELMSRFCYNNGRTNLSPSNVSLLHCVANFMEMKHSVSGTHNLLEQTEKSLEEISHWTWSELLVALKQGQDLHAVANSCGITEKCLDSLARRLAVACKASSCPSTCSPDSSGFRFSCDTRSTDSMKNSLPRATWWFDDVSVLNYTLIKILINKLLVSRNFDHVIISRFLFYYHKIKFYNATPEEKCKIVETIIEMLYNLDWSSVSCKSLFVILRVSLSSNISKCSRNKLETMIGMQMDNATLDNLLLPSPFGMTYLYDVNLILRLLKSFLRVEMVYASPTRMKKVSSLIDLYITEVAPDPCLQPSKFLALAVALPDSARESYDKIYRAIDMYLEVHAGLCEEEKTKICCALNYEKLSVEACTHLSHNKKFPPKYAVQGFIHRRLKLESLLCGTNNFNLHTKSPCNISKTCIEGRKDGRAHLQGTQWRVKEPEKVRWKTPRKMENFMKSRVLNSTSSISLPKLCS